MNNKKLNLGCCLSVLLYCVQAMAGQVVIPTSQQKDLNITIYNENVALINDVRETSLKEGFNQISYENISAQIIPESALLKGSGLTVIEQNFNYDLITSQSLLQKSVGQDVILQTIHPQTGEPIQKEGRLIAFNEQPIVEANGEIYTHFAGNVLLKAMPKGLISKPSLSMNLQSVKTGNQSIDLTYLTRGLSWQANYVAEINDTEDKMNLNGFITLANQSGTTFDNASIQLVAGDINIVRQSIRAPRMVAYTANAFKSEVAEDSLAGTIEEVSDFYVYSLPFKTSILSQQTKQVSLMSIKEATLKKEYIFDNSLRPYQTEAENIKPTIVYQFSNTKENGLGIPLPKGVIRLYKKSSNDKSIFLGENRIVHTPNLAKVRLRMGEAFDLFANAKRTSHEKIGIDTTISTYEITIKNGSDNLKEVIIFENFSNNWKITEENIPHTQETSDRVKWVVSIPANGETMLTYRVQITNPAKKGRKDY